MASPKILIVDLETSPAVVETFGLFDQNIGIKQVREPSRVLCFAAKWHGSKKTLFHAEWDEGGHEGMVAAAHKLIDEAHYVVGWNSRGFDMKLFNMEFLMAGFTPPSPYINIDLMLNAKKQFRFLSNKLDWYAQQLGVGAKVENGGMALWSALIRSDTPPKELAKARKMMKTYNIGDIAVTEGLFDELRPWLTGINMALHEEAGERCPNCGGDNLHARGYAYTTTMRYRRYQCQGCGKWSRGKTRESTTELRGM